jgi:hypothetical protein
LVTVHCTERHSGEESEEERERERTHERKRVTEAIYPFLSITCTSSGVEYTVIKSNKSDESTSFLLLNESERVRE